MSHFPYFQVKLEGDGGSPQAIEESLTGFEPHSDDGHPSKKDKPGAIVGPEKVVEPAEEENTAVDITSASDSLTPPADSADIEGGASFSDPPIARTETADTVVQKGTRMKPLDVETVGVTPPSQKALSSSEEVVAAVKSEGGGGITEATTEDVKPGDRRVRTEEAMPVSGGGSNGLCDGGGAVSEADMGDGEGKDVMVSKKRTLSSGWGRDCDVDSAARMVMDGGGSSGDGESEGEEHPRKRWGFIIAVAL